MASEGIGLASGGWLDKVVRLASEGLLVKVIRSVSGSFAAQWRFDWRFDWTSVYHPSDQRSGRGSASFVLNK